MGRAKRISFHDIFRSRNQKIVGTITTPSATIHLDHAYGELAAMTSGEFTSVQASLRHLLTEGTMTGASESQLLDRFCSQGDEYAFEAILRRHGPMVLAVCRRVLCDPNDVEDAFQATFLILIKKAGSIRNRAVLGTWLHGVARRVAVRAQIDSRRRRARERGAEMSAQADRRTGDEHLAELRAIIDEEVTRLTDKYRSPLVLCDLEGHESRRRPDSDVPLAPSRAACREPARSYAPG